MTLCGFCVVAALSIQASGLPFTFWRRTGKSSRMAGTSKARDVGDSPTWRNTWGCGPLRPDLSIQLSRPGTWVWRICATKAEIPADESDATGGLAAGPGVAAPSGIVGAKDFGADSVAKATGGQFVNCGKEPSLGPGSVLPIA